MKCVNLSVKARATRRVRRTVVEKDPETVTILCCECGVPIQSNSLNMCLKCIHNHVDITKTIPKQMVIHFCRKCKRYLQPPSEWIKAKLESLELLAVCLKKLKGDLKAVKLIDAGFVWTEPHSKRLKVKLTVRGTISDSDELQQVAIVEFTVTNQMCDDCHRHAAKDFWRCLVQVRQHSENKKTFYYLEQLILKHKAHAKSLGIKPKHGGLNFYFACEHHARKMVYFLQTVVPVKVTTSRRLISHDVRSNIFSYKYTWSVEIAPVSKDSVVCLSKRVCHQLGNISPICLIHKVAGGIHLIDPRTAQISELSGNAYFRATFDAICNPKQLVEYTVMDMEPVLDKDRNNFPGQGQISFGHTLCDFWLVRTSELGINENTVHTRSHLGHLLNVGDSVLGYNMSMANINDIEFEKLPAEQIPDVVLVRKNHNDGQTRAGKRFLKLKHLTNDLTNEWSKYDYQTFLEDLEEDSELSKNVNVYEDANKMSADIGIMSECDDNIPHIALADKLEDLRLDCAVDSLAKNATAPNGDNYLVDDSLRFIKT